MSAEFSSSPQRPMPKIYQELQRQYQGSVEQLEKGCMRSAKILNTLHSRYDELQNSRVEIPLQTAFEDERDVFYIVYWKLDRLFQSAIEFELSMKQKLDALTPMAEGTRFETGQRGDSRTDSCAKIERISKQQLTHLQSCYAYFGLTKNRLAQNLALLKVNLKCFCAIVSNRGEPLSTLASIQIQFSHLPNLSEALSRQVELSDKIQAAEEVERRESLIDDDGEEYVLISHKGDEKSKKSEG